MAAAILRHYNSTPSATGTTTLVTVPTSRALVISKVLVASNGNAISSSIMSLTAGGGPIISNLAMTAAGQVYTETGLVLLATETLTININTASAFTCHVFGEEVDN